jgi:hypothetical protein
MIPAGSRGRRSIAWAALAAILLLSLAPTISQVSASLGPDRHHGHHEAMPAQSAGHGSHASETHDSQSGDCWRACGYCDLFNHTPALELSAGGVLVAVDLPSVGVEATIGAPAHAIPRRSAQPRGPPSPAV